METITPTIRPTPKQELAWEKLLDLVTKFLLFGGGAGGGKTWMYCEWLLTDAYRYPGSRGFMARNELKRLMNSTYVTWTKVCAHHNIPRDDWTLDGKYNVIRFKNGSTIDLLDVAYKPTDPDYDRFGSTEYSHGFGEEIQEWHFKAFDVLKSRIGRHKIIADGKDIPRLLNLDAPAILQRAGPSASSTTHTWRGRCRRSTHSSNRFTATTIAPRKNTANSWTR